MISEKEAKRLAKRTLSEKRYRHTLNVCNLAKELARANNVSVEKAAIAALLHDIAKELPKQSLLQILQSNAIITGDTEKRPAAVWHGVAAAILAESQYGVTDTEILSAIACHTTGKANMSTLDQIIYMADMASAERTYPEAESLRKQVRADLYKGTICGLGMSIAWLKEQGKPVDPATLQAYASLRQIQYGGETIEPIQKTTQHQSF